jgi:2-polyprenyl-3-methyl-5-hydroxy-6-metoxy-1,4-benzoquinol methylase
MVSMKPEERKDFNKEAAQWDSNPGRVKLANDIADAIIREAAPAPGMDALDFGCGTGLVTLRLQPLVRSITGADSSPGMLAVLENKVKAQGLTNVRTQLVDFEKGGRVEGKFHLVMSSMTMHHVKDTSALFRQWHGLLLPGGLLAAADLDTEDGSFHGNNAGVFHLGLDRENLKRLLRETGFSDVRDVTAATVTRDAEGGGKRDFPVFLIIGRR